MHCGDLCFIEIEIIFTPRNLSYSNNLGLEDKAMKTEADENTIKDTTETSTAASDIKETAKTGSQTSTLTSADATNKSNPIKETKSIGYNKYIGSQWKQECVPGCSPNLKLSRLHRILFFIGIPLLSIGIYLWTIKNAHQVYVFDYTDCKSSTNSANSSPCADLIRDQPYDDRSCICKFEINIRDHIHGKVLINYRLENFHQNLRRYRESRDEKQLISPFKKPDVPECLAPKKPDKACNKKYRYASIKLPNSNKTIRKAIYPCGQIPNSMFSDRIISLSKDGLKLLLYRHKYHPKGFKDEFRNPRLRYTNSTFDKIFSKPIAWSNKFWKHFWEVGGVQSYDFHNWMRISALPSFTMPYRYFVGNISDCVPKGVPEGICRGYYQLEIEYNFDVKSIQGRKKIEITSGKPTIEDRSGFLAIACTAVGSFSLLLGFFSLIDFLCSKRANKFKTSYSTSEFRIRGSLAVEDIKQPGAETNGTMDNLKGKETAVFLTIKDEEDIPGTSTLTKPEGSKDIGIPPLSINPRGHPGRSA